MRFTYIIPRTSQFQALVLEINYTYLPHPSYPSLFLYLSHTMGWNTTMSSNNMHSQEAYSDLLSFTFDGPKPYNQNQPLFIDAEDPSRSFTGVQFRQLVRTLIAGLKAHNVQPGDCVLLHLGNSVSERKIQKKRKEKKRESIIQIIQIQYWIMIVLGK